MTKNINILDGGFGQAIINKGLNQIGTLWGCSAYLDQKDHQKVIETHLEFINAGSKIITTSNFTIRKRRLAQNKLENKLKEFLEISGKLAQEAVKLSNKNIKIAGSLPTRGETYKSDVFLSDEELLKEFHESASIINPFVDLFYLDVLCSSKEIKLALESIKFFNKQAIVGIHLKNNGKLPSGESIADLKKLFFLSDEELLKEFHESASIINPFVDLFYLDVLCSSKEIKLALESIKFFNKQAIVGIHLKNNGKLPSGESIADLKKLLSAYNIRAVIGGCISPEIYQKVSNEFKSLDYEYGFKVNAFENIPDNWSITPNANPNLSLGKRKDLDSNKFVEFCKSAIKDGASFVGGCCEINHNHIKALSNEL